jgi:hypothetical protein
VRHETVSKNNGQKCVWKLKKMEVQLQSDQVAFSPPKVVVSTKTIPAEIPKYGTIISKSKLPFPLKAPKDLKGSDDTTPLYSVKVIAENPKTGGIGISTTRAPVPVATSSGPKSPPVRTIRRKGEYLFLLTLFLSTVYFLIPSLFN